MPLFSTHRFSTQSLSWPQNKAAVVLHFGGSQLKLAA